MRKYNNTSRSTLIVCVLSCLMTFTLSIATTQLTDHCTSANNPQLIYNLNLANQIQFGTKQVYLGTKNQIQASETYVYNYFAEDEGTSYKVRIQKNDRSQATQLNTSVDTTIGTATYGTTGGQFLLAQSGVIAFQIGLSGSGSLKFFGFDKTNSPTILTEVNTITLGGTETLTKIITGNGQATNLPSFYFLTTNTDNTINVYQATTTNGVVTPISTPYSFITTGAVSSNFISACENGFIQIDNTANGGPKISKFNSGQAASTATSPGVSSGSPTTPTFVHDTTVYINNEVYIINFDNSFFVAMYDSGKAASTIFRILDVSGTPTYSDIQETAVSVSITLQPFTDNTANFMQVSSNAGVVKLVKLFFVNSYTSAGQVYSQYNTPSTAVDTVQQALYADLDTSNAETLKISFNYASSTQYIYILKTSTSNSKIIKYTLTAADVLTKLHQITLSDDSFTELTNTAQQTEMFQVQIYCGCSSIQINTFVCFAGSEQCTIAIASTAYDCTL